MQSKESHETVGAVLCTHVCGVGAHGFRALES
jgi:hypothetical protein